MSMMRTFDDPFPQQEVADFLKDFNPREQQEILFALKYVEEFNHGTSGHLAYTVIAKLVALLQERK